jgi:hypothetical protein
MQLSEYSRVDVACPIGMAIRLNQDVQDNRRCAFKSGWSERILVGFFNVFAYLDYQ